MSHRVRVKSVKFVGKDTLAATCKALGLAAPVQGKYKLFTGGVIEGEAITLPGWRYPVVIEEDGTINFDNYNGTWGDEKQLHKLQQAYGAQAGRQICYDHGMTLEEEILEDGSIKLCAREDDFSD